MDKWFYALLFLLSVFVCSCTQITLKKSAAKDRKGIRIYLNKTVIISNIIFVGATLVTVFLYRHIQLSTGALLNSAGYVFVPALSIVFLKEKMSRRKVIGIVFIVIGIAVYALLGESM